MNVCLELLQDLQLAVEKMCCGILSFLRSWKTDYFDEKYNFFFRKKNLNCILPFIKISLCDRNTKLIIEFFKGRKQILFFALKNYYTLCYFFSENRKLYISKFKFM